MRDNDLRIIAVLVIMIAFVVLGVAFSKFTFQTTTEESIEEEEEMEVEDTFEEIDKQQVSFVTDITVYHDNKRNVTCWVSSTGGGRGGISCIPDHLLTP